MPVRLALPVCIIYYKYLLDSFLKSQEVIALLLKSYNSLYNSYIPTESRLIDISSESNLLVGVTN
jgi:hypothetical protein